MISRDFSTIQRKFVATIVGLAVSSVLVLGFILYETNAIRFNGDISSDGLHSLVSEDEAVVQYLEEEKDFEAHFITIANLVKNDQQQTLGRSLILMTLPILAIAGLVGYLVARRLLEPVQEAYESQERFIQDAAHELRNPLAAMSAAIQSAESKATNKGELAQTMKRQTRRLVKINEDLLFLERRSHTDELERINVSELLNDVLEDLQPAISKKKIVLSSQIHPNVEKIMHTQDFVRLAKNIVENAVKYTPKDKKISVSLKEENNQILFVVKDQGVGIPQDDLDRLGERFFRSSNVSRMDGSGLGLSIVKKILEKYNGDITITSQLKKGTKVVIKL